MFVLYSVGGEVINILIIEDEFALADVIRESLLEENYNVDISTDGLKGYNMLCNKLYDLIILDVMLPNMNGFEILKRIRNENINSKVIMLTAKSSLDDKLNGLENGANGVFSYGGSATTNNSTNDGTTINISNSKITTSKDNSGGIMATGGGIINASNLEINTSSIKLTGDSYVTSLVNSISDNSNINFNGYKLYVNGIAIN